MPLSDPADPPERRQQTLRAIGMGMSPMHPRFWNEIASEWNEIAEQLGEPLLRLIDLPPLPSQDRSTPLVTESRLAEILQQAIPKGP